MGTWVALNALGVDFAVSIAGVGDTDARQFIESWEWCGAHEVSADEVAEAVASAALGGPAIEVVRGWVDAPGGGAHEPNEREPNDGVREWGPSEHPMSASTYRGLADSLSGLLTRLAIDARRHDLLMLHAGGVADPETGNVIAFIGPSGRGKTTASIALGSVFGYVTDETLAIRDDLGVLAYGKPLSVKLPAPEMWKDQVSPTMLGLQRPPVALQLVGVVLLDRQESIGGRDGGAGGGAGGRMPVVRPVGLAESVEELVPQISYLPERERPLQRLAAVLEACGGLQQVTYTEATSLREVFAELFAAAAAGAGVAARSGAPAGAGEPEIDGPRGVAGGTEVGEPRGVAGGTEGGEPRGVADDSGAREPGEAARGAEMLEALDADRDDDGLESGAQTLRAEYLDAIHDGDSMVVLSGSTVRVLGGIAPTIMVEARNARTLEQLVDAVVAAHGDPESGQAAGLVGAAVGELREIGLLTVVDARD